MMIERDRYDPLETLTDLIEDEVPYDDARLIAIELAVEQGEYDRELAESLIDNTIVGASLAFRAAVKELWRSIRDALIIPILDGLSRYLR